MPLWLYVKSILEDFRRPKTAILYIIAAKNFAFLGIFDNFKCEILPKIKPSKMLKWHFLTFWYQVKLISRKIRVVGKWLNFQTVQCLDLERCKSDALVILIPNLMDRKNISIPGEQNALRTKIAFVDWPHFSPFLLWINKWV